MLKQRITAALLALGLGLSLCDCGGTVPSAQETPKQEQTGSHTAVDYAWAPEALTSVVYPEKPEYPDETHWDEKKTDAWF